MRSGGFFRRHVVLPAEHGAWVFLACPLLIGLFAGGRWTRASFDVVVAALAVFLVRQPITLLVKAYSGRRGRDSVGAAWFWVAVYGSVALVATVDMVRLGFGYVLLLAAPGLPVLLWHLFLISRRAERRQWLVEILASGALALGAPAAYWIGIGRPDPQGWFLWGLTWAQAGASIVYAYLRLAQRKPGGDLPEVRTLTRAALLFGTFNLAAAGGLGAAGLVSDWLFVPFAVQWVEILLGIHRPAVGLKPKTIGLRQLAVSSLFTLLFIVTWPL